MASNQNDEDSKNDTSSEQTPISMEDTGESRPLQGQETPPTQNNGTANDPKLASKPKIAPPKGSKEGVEQELKKYAGEMNDYMAWKEDLCLRSVELQIGGPYFTLWTKEANLFFRRLVILKKRSERVKSKQRA